MQSLDLSNLHHVQLNWTFLSLSIYNVIYIYIYIYIVVLFFTNIFSQETSNYVYQFHFLLGRSPIIKPDESKFEKLRVCIKEFSRFSLFLLIPGKIVKDPTNLELHSRWPDEKKTVSDTRKSLLADKKWDRAVWKRWLKRSGSARFSKLGYKVEKCIVIHKFK